MCLQHMHPPPAAPDTSPLSCPPSPVLLIDLVQENFELIRHDVVEPILLEVDQIFHLACPASPVHYKWVLGRVGRGLRLHIAAHASRRSSAAAGC